MKTLRTMFATILMIGVLSCSTVFADGILVAGLTDTSNTSKTKTSTTQQCTDTTVKVDSGILVAGIGILVAGFTGTGILVAGFEAEPKVDCGILVAG